MITAAQKTRAVIAGKNLEIEIVNSRAVLDSDAATEAIRKLTARFSGLDKLVADQSEEIKRLRGEG